MNDVNGTVRILVPVDVVVRDGEVYRVIVLDETHYSVARDGDLVYGIDGDGPVFDIAREGDWPAWEFGY